MQRIRWANVMIVAGAALLPLAASAQGGAKKTPAPPPAAAPATAAQLTKLQVALQKVALRVTELEQQHARDVEDDEGRDADLLKMQDVIARLAKSMGETQKLLDATRATLAATDKSLAAVKAAQAKQTAIGNAKAQGARVVRAPFIVVDAAGSPLFQVEPGASGLGHVLIGDPKGSHISMQAEISKGTSISMINGGVNRVALFGSADYSAVTTTSGLSRAWVAAHPQDGGYVGLASDQGKNIAQMLMRNGRGYFELNDGVGNKMVEAGSLGIGKGYVIVQPSRPSVSPNGNPSLLLGGKP